MYRFHALLSGGWPYGLCSLEPVKLALTNSHTEEEKDVLAGANDNR